MGSASSLSGDNTDDHANNKNKLNDNDSDKDIYAYKLDIRSTSKDKFDSLNTQVPSDSNIMQVPKSPKIGSNKFECEAKYFVFGDDKDYKDGLTNKIKQPLERSMRKECIENDNGEWSNEFDYVVNQVAGDDGEGTRIRDKGNDGKTLQTFAKHEIALKAGLTQAEVAALRLYTGKMFKPWNQALREYGQNPTLLKNWSTCISVLYSAIFKLSFTSPKREVWRGVNEKSRILSSDFLESSIKGGIAGGVELAFMSTSMDFNVAAFEYASNYGHSSKGTVLQFLFDAANRGANVRWVSQYPHEEELLYPPCTYLTCTEPPTTIPIGKDGAGMRLVKVRANVSTARPNVENIFTVDDPENDNYIILDDPKYVAARPNDENILTVDDSENDYDQILNDPKYADATKKYFMFGDFDDYKYGLTKKIRCLNRTIREEFENNCDGKWVHEFEYVVDEKAKETDEGNNRIRDEGHSGMTLQNFMQHPIAVEAGLTQAEVTVLRLYTGKMYIPWNEALRLYSVNPSRLRCWSTCIAVLNNAIFKLSILSTKTTVYRGVSEAVQEFSPDFLEPKDKNSFAGGVELAFMTTFIELNVAIEYARKGNDLGKGSVLKINFDTAIGGASVHWVSQYPQGNEFLYPPCTSLTTESVSSLGNNLKLIHVRATVSTARPNVDNILTVDDSDIKQDPKYSGHLNTEYFMFGTMEDYKYGLTHKIISLERSMREECMKNDGGKWLNDFEYVVDKEAESFFNEEWKCYRDQGNEGKTLLTFAKHEIALKAGLTQAEVAALRLYTGNLYKPWNAALRLSAINPSRLNYWKTCIAVLNSAIAKLSSLSPPCIVYRSFDESQCKLPPKFREPKDNYSDAGVVEIAFMTTVDKLSEAVKYAKKDKNDSSEGTILAIHFDAASRGADVQWVSQYPQKKELIYPPGTYLTSYKCGIIPPKEPGEGMRLIQVRATVSTARPSFDHILTIDDPETNVYEIRKDPSYFEKTKNKYFVFGSDEDYKYGLTKKIRTLNRSIKEECTRNDGGMYLKIFNDVEKTLNEDYKILKGDAELTKAEVATLRLYCEGLYKPWNDALRLYSINPSKLRCWCTCISLLYNAIIKLSYQANHGTTVYRVVDERELKLPEQFDVNYQKSNDISFAGGVELAFMSTYSDKEEALNDAINKFKGNATLFEIHFDKASKGADIKDFYQSHNTKRKAQILYPPCTYLTCEEWNIINDSRMELQSMRQITVRASVSTARVDVKNIRSIDDHD